jgi:hypothetical protein
MLFSIETDRGQCLVEAHNEPQARKFMREEFGRSTEIRKVSRKQKDIDWAKSMGARIHNAKETQ